MVGGQAGGTGQQTVALRAKLVLAQAGSRLLMQSVWSSDNA